MYFYISQPSTFWANYIIMKCQRSFSGSLITPLTSKYVMWWVLAHELGTFLIVNLLLMKVWQLLVIFMGNILRKYFKQFKGLGPNSKALCCANLPPSKNQFWFVSVVFSFKGMCRENIYWKLADHIMLPLNQNHKRA